MYETNKVILQTISFTNKNVLRSSESIFLANRNDLNVIPVEFDFKHANYNL